MGKEVALAGNARPALSIDIKNINYKTAAAAIDKYISKVGGSSGARSKFPGTQITFKSGEWTFGFGDKAKKLKDGTEFAFNVMNLMAGWVKWEENDNGKRFPRYTDMCFPAAGDDMIERESLGDLDPQEWDTDDKGNPMDPWRPVLVYPVRDENGDTINHLMLTAKSSVIAGFNLFRDLMEEIRMHEGELPVVKISADKASREIKTIDPKTKKEKKTKQVWDVPTFEVTGWTSATEADNPGPGGVSVATDDGEEADVGEVAQRARTADVKQTAKPTAAKPATKGKKKVEVEDDDTI